MEESLWTRSKSYLGAGAQGAPQQPRAWLLTRSRSTSFETLVTKGKYFALNSFLIQGRCCKGLVGRKGYPFGYYRPLDRCCPGGLGCNTSSPSRTGRWSSIISLDVLEYFSALYHRGCVRRDPLARALFAISAGLRALAA